MTRATRLAPTTPHERSPRLPALRHRDFRLLWAGLVVSLVGSQMQITAVHWQVSQLLAGRSAQIEVLGRRLVLDAAALGLGGIGLTTVVPLVTFALLGGLVADAHDRRRVMMATQMVLALAAAALAWLAWTDRTSVLAIYLASAATASAGAFNAPAQQSLIPNLVPRRDFPNAISLNTLSWQLGTVIGPAVAGAMLVVGTRLAGEGRVRGTAIPDDAVFAVIYGLNALSFLAVIAALAAMRHRSDPAGRSAMGWHGLREGIGFVRRQEIIWSTMLLDFLATFFSSARNMLPLVAGQVLGLGPGGYGLLAAAQPAGSVVAGGLLALRPRIRHQGRVLLASVVVYGLATVAFGLSRSLPAAALFFALTGAADTVSTVIRATVRQLLTPDRLRGRMVAVNMVFFQGGPQLGEVEAGLVAAAFGVTASIVSGGVATVVAAAAVARGVPSLASLTLEKAEAAAETAAAG